MRSNNCTRILFSSVLLALVASVQVGCGSVQTRTIQVQGTPAELGAISVEVHNVRGDVRVLVDPRRDEPQIKASFRHDTFVTKPTRDESYRSAPVVASYVRQGTGVVLRIEAGQADNPNFSADLVIRVPACAGVLIRTTDGKVKVVGASGGIDITNASSGNHSAPISVRTDAAVTDAVRLITNNGSVFYSPGLDSAGRYELTTETGSIRVSAKVGALTGVALTDPNVWIGTLNGGENPVQLHSDSGRVELRLREPIVNKPSGRS